MRVRELLNDELDGRIDAIERSGDYPRQITDMERFEAWWFSYGPATFWLWQSGPEEIILHLCIPAEDQRRLFAREWMVVIRVIGQLLGFRRIRFPGADDESVASYLRRWGWTQDARGMFLDLGSLSNGETTEGSEDQIQSAG